MLDLRRLRYFVAVADGLSFSRAAEDLLVAQSAISRQVAVLETMLGVQLLERSPQAVELTPAGASLLPRARTLLRDADALEEEARALAGGTRGTARIGYSTSLAYGTAPTLIEAARRRLPDAAVDVQLLPTPQLGPALTAGDLDLALARCPVPRAGVTATAIRHERLGVLTRTDHPLVSDDAVDLIDIRDERIWLHERTANPGHYDVIVGLCRAAGFEPQLAGSSAPFDPSFGHVAGGGAVAIVAESTAAGLPAGLVFLPLHTATTVEIALLCRDDEERPLVLEARDAIIAAAAGAWPPGRGRLSPG